MAPYAGRRPHVTSSCPRYNMRNEARRIHSFDGVGPSVSGHGPGRRAYRRDVLRSVGTPEFRIADNEYHFVAVITFRSLRCSESERRADFESCSLRTKYFCRIRLPSVFSVRRRRKAVGVPGEIRFRYNESRFSGPFAGTRPRRAGVVLFGGGRASRRFFRPWLGEFVAQSVSVALDPRVRPGGEGPGPAQRALEGRDG